MGLTATSYFGRTPHPSVAEIDERWLDREMKKPTRYVRVCMQDKDLGVLQVIDARINAPGRMFLDPRAWLADVPPPGCEVRIEHADDADYRNWRRKHAKPRHRLLMASFVLTVIGASIEMAWSVGKYWSWAIVGDGPAGAAQVIKWALLVLGVGGIALYRDYRAIE